MTEVEVTKDGVPLPGSPYNDPSDAQDLLIRVHDDKMPKELFLKKDPDLGWSWDDLPFRWGWKGSIYEMKAVNIKSLQENKMRQAPLNMGDVFVVDDHGKGITVRNKGKHTFEEILAMWPEEQLKDWAYDDFKSVTFFNEKGTVALAEWLEGKKDEGSV